MLHACRYSSCLGSDNLLGVRLGTVCAVLSILGTIFLAWAINGDLDCDLSTLDLLAVHLGNSFLLQLLRFERNEAEASSLSWLVPGLELLDHESWDWSESNLCGDWLVVIEEFLELQIVSIEIQ